MVKVTIVISFPLVVDDGKVAIANNAIMSQAFLKSNQIVN